MLFERLRVMDLLDVTRRSLQIDGRSVGPRPFRPTAGDGYQDSLSLYEARFIPNALDPTGETLFVVDRTKKDNSFLYWCCMERKRKGREMVYAARNVAIASICSARKPDESTGIAR